MQAEGKILEKELYKPIYNYFQKLGYDVHAEVKECDITASKEDELIIIELKTAINLDLLIQATKRQRLTETVYIAIPKPKYSIFTKKWKDLQYLIRRLGLGIIFVSLKTKGGRVEVVQEPAPFDRQKSMQRTNKKRKGLTAEIKGRHGNFNEGGSTRVKIMTAYKENAIQIACCFKKYGQLTPGQLRKIGTGDKTLSILSNNFYGWFAKVKHGTYMLSEKGSEVFDKYPELVAYYESTITNTQEGSAKEQKNKA